MSPSKWLVAAAALTGQALTVSGAAVRRDASCSGTFTPMTAGDYIAAINPGWNLGNTLDATPDEDSWNNKPVVQSTFDYVAAAGFKSVRIPVTYQYHFTGSSPDWTINSTWLQRVSDVVDMALSSGLYVITNMHHDSAWVDVTASDANITEIEEKFYRAWVQIGETLGCKSEKVAFEPINEPPCSTAADGEELNKLNGLFLQALKDSGAYNSQRVVTLVGGGEDVTMTSEWFVAPTGYDNPYAIQYHYYNPYDYIFQAWGKTTWGSDDDKATLEAEIASVRGNFTDVPLVIGETQAGTLLETASRRKYFDFLGRTATKYNTSVIIWDNGDAYLDRATGTWREPELMDIIKRSIKLENNSLSDSTTDILATTQSSSAYVFHKVGDELTDETVNFLLNGNTVASIIAADGTPLTESTDYTVSEGNVTLASSFLSQYISETAETGSKTNLTVTFSAGANATVEIVQWDTPVLGSTSSEAVSGSDLVIPITWNGLPQLVAVKMIRSDGQYLFFQWTEWYGELQQGRGTYSSHWDTDGDNVKLMTAAVDAVIDAGLDTVFTFEFRPRVPENVANYTLTAPASATATSTATTTSLAPGTTPTPIQSGMVDGCTEFHLVVSGDTCWAIATNDAQVDLDTFYGWNPAVGDDCSGLWANYYVCISVS